MNRRTLFKLSGLIASPAAALSAAEEAARETPAARPLVNPFETPGQWYKAALHVHTTTSDGDVDVPTRLEQYRAAGYHVVAITDHWKTNDVSQASSESFLVISGMEAHPDTATGAPKHHFVCLHLPHPFELDRKQPAQQLIDRVKAAGGTVIYAHPYWTAHTLEEMTEVTGYAAMEVFNGVCQSRWHKGLSSVHWDQLLNKGHIIPALATDDVHKSTELNQGWTLIKAPSLDVTSILQAIANGCHYSSNGPAIESCHLDADAITVHTSPAQTIRFFFAGSAGGYVVQAGDGAPLTHAEWRFGIERRRFPWIRVEVVDAAGHCAWTNPMTVPRTGSSSARAASPPK